MAQRVSFYFLQFFEELATDSKPEKVEEVAVKETQGKQVLLTEEITLLTLCPLLLM